MQISIIQMEVKMANPEQNYQKALDLMNRAMREKPDVLVLPEMLNTGFFPQNLELFCDKNGQKTTEIFSKFAKENNVNIVAGSVADMRGNLIYNSSYIFDRNGNNIALYDKIHSFSLSGEQRVFNAGNNMVDFTLDGVKCSVIICYDLRFCELARMAVLNGTQLLFIPAQWPLARISHWKALNIARAIENQIFICCVNGCGYANELKFGGNSMLIDPNGEEILHLGEDENIQSGEIRLEILDKVRNQIAVFRDRRAEIYKI